MASNIFSLKQRRTYVRPFGALRTVLAISFLLLFHDVSLFIVLYAGKPWPPDSSVIEVCIRADASKDDHLLQHPGTTRKGCLPYPFFCT